MHQILTAALKILLQRLGRKWNRVKITRCVLKIAAFRNMYRFRIPFVGW